MVHAFDDCINCSTQVIETKTEGAGKCHFERLELQVSSWPEVTTHPHRFGGKEFRFKSAEIGHVHTGGIVDIPFPRSVRDALLADGLAEEHRWVPNSGWVTFRIRSAEDVSHAIWLMRLSYLRYELKVATDANTLLDRHSKELHLSAKLKSLFEPFVAKPAAAQADMSW